MSGEILRGLDIDDYHAFPAWSNSKLQLLDSHGPLYAVRKMRGELAEQKETDALRKGSFLDALLTGGSTEVYVVAPEGHDGRTKEGKAWKKSVEAEGRIIVSAAEVAWARDAYLALMAIPEAREVLQHAEFQVSFRAQLPSHPLITVQARPDFTMLDGIARYDFRPTFPDLKSTGGTIQEFIDRSILNYGYATQAALVRLAAEACGVDGETAHEWLVVTKPDQPPVQAAVVRCTDAWLEIGMRRAYDLLNRVHLYTERNEWPRTEVTLVDAEPPEWLVKREEWKERNEALGEAA